MAGGSMGRLRRATEGLDRSIDDLDAVLRQLDMAARQLPQSTAGNPTSDAALLSRLVGMRRRFAELQRSLSTASTGYAAARDVHREVQDGLGNMLNDLRDRLADYDRRQGALQRSLRGLITFYGRDTDAEPGFDLPVGSHTYIAVDIPQFFDLLIALDRLLTLDDDFAEPGERYRAVSFLEVGAGSGRNMFLARVSQLFRCKSVAGFDINADQVATGRQLFGLVDELSVADAMSFDYGGFDVVFSYRPFSDIAMQTQFEARMAATMRPGAYLLAPLSEDPGRYPNLTATGLSPDIWKNTG